ncbi:MAG: endopeptidase La [Flavobacteriales bacterium]|nr:endopeptidase La [Flavobacteriales bacterium]
MWKKDDNMTLFKMLGEESEFIPLITSEDEDNFNAQDIPELLPILPLRNTVLFPGVVIPITVGRDKSIRLIREAHNGNKIIGVLSQKDAGIEDPNEQDLNRIGTVAQILKMLRMPDGSTTAIIQGKKRFEVKQFTQTEPYLKAVVTIFSEQKPSDHDQEFNALVSQIKELSLNIIQQSPHIPSEATFAIKNIESPSFLINFISSNLNAEMEEKQQMLEVRDLKERATMVLRHLNKELQLLELKNEIQSKVKVDIDRQQKEYFLHQQMKMIQEELGAGETQDIKELKEKAKHKKWDQKVKEIFEKEISKLERMNPMVAEYSVQLNYLEFMTELPWNEYTEDNFNLKNAKKILDRDHYGLDKIKERILEHLAVLKLKGDMKAPILCFAGPPGVGKTSLGKSIAEALGRKYIRMSLGGLKDESEIRGHRKTYIGAMAGRILQSMKKAGSSNPVFILDEIDKVGNDFHGDPSSALLEVLDPEQNNAFHDNFLDIDFDLSKVMFIATANNLATIQPALRDRMEIIELTGYSVEEKVEIAHRHLLPKQAAEHGLDPAKIKIDKPTLEYLIEHYTRESGVRNLDRMLASITRNIAKSIVMGERVNYTITPARIEKILGKPIPREKYENNQHAGVVVGLAWTAVGGDILFIETSLSPGRGKLTLTGNLGGVMKESAIIALEYLKAHAADYKINPKAFDRWNVHIHVPEGATPKDGPSAGITMFTALVSAFTQRKVKARIAMTGEITLRGQVLPVGGIKEKILAAKRAQIKDVILCEDNRKDVEEINPKFIRGLNIHYVKTMDEVITLALTKEKVKNPLPINGKLHVATANA